MLATCGRSSYYRGGAVWSKGHTWKPGDGTSGYFSAKKVALPPAEEERRQRYHEDLEKTSDPSLLYNIVSPYSYTCHTLVMDRWPGYDTSCVWSEG
jgi:hypothetical protein